MNLQLMNVRTGAAVLAAALMLCGCHGDPNETKMQYTPDMADSAAIKSQREFLEPPEGSVALTAILYPATIEESEKVLQNPFPANEQVVAKGKQLYNTYCIVCHGADAKGQGFLGDTYPRPPDLTIEPNLKRGDGFFFHKITFGGPIMPGYGHAISAHERWQIVHYLRVLQK